MDTFKEIIPQEVSIARYNNGYVFMVETCNFQWTDTVVEDNTSGYIHNTTCCKSSMKLEKPHM